MYIYHSYLLIFDTQSVDCWVVGLRQVSPLSRYVSHCPSIGPDAEKEHTLFRVESEMNSLKMTICSMVPRK